MAVRLSRQEEGALAALVKIQSALLGTDDFVLDEGSRWCSESGELNWEVEFGPGYIDRMPEGTDLMRARDDKARAWAMRGLTVFVGKKRVEVSQHFRRVDSTGLCEAVPGAPTPEDSLMQGTQHFYEKPKQRLAPHAERRCHIEARRKHCLELYEVHRATMLMMVSRHGVDRGWQDNFKTTYRQVANLQTYLCRGARNRLHAYTQQAGFASAVVDGHLRSTGLEVALWCDFWCADCKADTLRMTDALLTATGQVKLKKATPVHGYILGKDLTEYDVMKWPELDRRLGVKAPQRCAKVKEAGLRMVFLKGGKRPIGIRRDDAREAFGIE